MSRRLRSVGMPWREAVPARPGRKYCLKVMRAYEVTGHPVLPDDPPPLCGRPAGYKLQCRSEAAIARSQAAKAAAKRLAREIARGLSAAA